MHFTSVLALASVAVLASVVMADTAVNAQAVHPPRRHHDHCWWRHGRRYCNFDDDTAADSDSIVRLARRYVQAQDYDDDVYSRCVNQGFIRRHCPRCHSQLGHRWCSYDNSDEAETTVSLTRRNDEDDDLLQGDSLPGDSHEDDSHEGDPLQSDSDGFDFLHVSPPPYPHRCGMIDGRGGHICHNI